MPAFRFLEGCCWATGVLAVDEDEAAVPALLCWCCSLTDEAAFVPSDVGRGLRVAAALGRGGPSLAVAGVLPLAGRIFFGSPSPFFSATESKSVMSRSLSSA